MKIYNLYKSYIKQGSNAKEIMLSLAKFIDNHRNLNKDAVKVHLFHEFYNNLSNSSNHIANKIYALLEWGLNHDIFTLSDLMKCYQTIIGHFGTLMYLLPKEHNANIHRANFSPTLKPLAKDSVQVSYFDVCISANNDLLVHQVDTIELLDFFTIYASDFSETSQYSWGYGQQFHRFNDKVNFDNRLAQLCNKIVTNIIW